MVMQAFRPQGLGSVRRRVGGVGVSVRFRGHGHVPRGNGCSSKATSRFLVVAPLWCGVFTACNVQERVGGEHCGHQKHCPPSR